MRVLRIDRPDGRKVLKFDGPSGRGLWWRLRRRIKKRGRGFRRGLCRRVVKGKVLKMDRPAAGGFLSLTGPWGPRVVDCPVGQCLESQRYGIYLFVSYGMMSITVISHLRWLSPFGGWRHHLPPAERWDNKAPQSNPFISRTTISTGYSAPACGGSPAKRARGNAFPTPAGRLYGFI